MYQVDQANPLTCDPAAFPTKQYIQLNQAKFGSPLLDVHAPETPAKRVFGHDLWTMMKMGVVAAVRRHMHTHRETRTQHKHTHTQHTSTPRITNTNTHARTHTRRW